MTHLTDVIEEEREAFHQLHQTNLVTKEMRDDFITQAMTKTALAVIEEIEKLPRRSTVIVDEKSDGTIVKSYTVAFSDIETLKNTLTTPKK